MEIITRLNNFKEGKRNRKEEEKKGV